MGAPAASACGEASAFGAAVQAVVAAVILASGAAAVLAAVGEVHVAAGLVHGGAARRDAVGVGTDSVRLLLDQGLLLAEADRVGLVAGVTGNVLAELRLIRDDESCVGIFF